MARMFDYEAVARRLGVESQDLDRICRRVRQEFPDDEMLFELHVLRALLAVEGGYVRLDQLLSGDSRASG